MLESGFVEKPKQSDNVNEVFAEINEYILQKETMILYAN